MDRRYRHGLTSAVYVLGFVLLCAAQTQRGLDDPRFFLWSGICEWSAYALVAALLGWIAQQLRTREFRLIAAAGDPWPPDWFQWAQTLLTLGTGFLAGWIALDFAFADIGLEQAVLGLAGRRAGCVASLMLVGTTILMAWQNRGRARNAWQFAALFSGVLFTATLGWSSIALPSAGDLRGSRWLLPSQNLLISLAMMTLMTGLGLRRVLPRGSDWVDRGRQAMPAFAGLAVLMLVIVVTLKLSA
jgi:hypothetical protein